MFINAYLTNIARQALDLKISDQGAFPFELAGLLNGW